VLKLGILGILIYNFHLKFSALNWRRFKSTEIDFWHDRRLLRYLTRLVELSRA